MTTAPDFRAELERLVDLYESVGGNWCPHGYTYTWNDALASARTALATAPPKPPTDDEIMGLMPQQMHEHLATAVRAMAEQEGIDSTPAKGIMRIILNRHIVDLARAALERWGHG